ncbi:hypothetical protein Tco_0344982 [Tanacetum coccineum]
MYWKPYIRLKLVQVNTIPPGLDALVNTMEGVTCIAYMASQLLWQNQLRFVDHSVPDLRRSLELHHCCREINQWMFAGSGMRWGPTNQLKLHLQTEKAATPYKRCTLRLRSYSPAHPINLHQLWAYVDLGGKSMLRTSDAERLLLAVQYASQNQYFGREMIRSPRGLSFAGVQATLGDDLMLLIDMVRMQSSLKYMLRSEERAGFSGGLSRQGTPFLLLVISIGTISTPYVHVYLTWCTDLEVAKRGRLSGCVRSELNENKLKIILDPAAGNWPFVQAQQLPIFAFGCCWCLAFAEGVVEEKGYVYSCFVAL